MKADMKKAKPTWQYEKRTISQSLACQTILHYHREQQLKGDLPYSIGKGRI